MNTYINVRQCLAEFFSQCELIQSNGAEKVKTESNIQYYFQKLLFLLDHEKKYGEF
jgi:hypothetical protein